MKTNNLLTGGFLLFCLVSCQAPGAAPSDSGATSPSSPGSALAQDSSNLFALPEGYDFRLDSTRLGSFVYNWYLFAYRYEYQLFQKDMVEFPFPCITRDSFQHSDTLYFSTLESMFDWRKNHLVFFNREQSDIRRALYEGYPEFTFDTMPFSHLDRIPETGSIVVTYIRPWSKADYYFRRSNGRWFLWKSAHRQYARSELKKMPEGMFEDFLLRFISDASFQIQHVKFPLKHQRRWDNAEAETSSRTKEQWNVWDSQCYMTVYPNFGKERPEPSDMYLTVRNEGGGCGWHRFKKVKNSWQLTEELNCSN